MEAKHIINALGGSTILSEILNATNTKQRTPQAINHWKVRGIPKRVLMQNPSLFAKGERLAKKNTSLL